MTNKIILNKKTLFTLALAISSFFSFSQDRLFTYAYQSGVLDAGQHELEVWNTFRAGRSDYFRGLDHRTEMEFGLGHNIQTSIYLNVSGETAAETIAGVKNLNSQTSFSVSNEWKYKLLDPMADAFGFALYGEYTFGTSEQGLECKLIFDKKIDRMNYALNLVGEAVQTANTNGVDVVYQTERVAEVNFSMAYQIQPTFHLTFEALNGNGFNPDGTLKHSVLYSGFGISWVNNTLWVNLTLMPQVYAFKGATDGNLNLTDNEKLQTRLAISYSF